MKFWRELENSGGIDVFLEHKHALLGSVIVSRQQTVKGYPQGVPPPKNSKTTKSRQTEDLLKLLDKVQSISTFDLERITAEIEKRKSMDCETETEQEEWEQPANNEKETIDDPMH